MYATTPTKTFTSSTSNNRAVSTAQFDSGAAAGCGARSSHSAGGRSGACSAACRRTISAIDTSRCARSTSSAIHSSGAIDSGGTSHTRSTVCGISAINSGDTIDSGDAVYSRDAIRSITSRGACD